MRIAVDFDHVLFDTDGFYSELPVNKHVFKDTFEAAYDREDEAYRIKEHVSRLNDHPDVTGPVTQSDLKDAYSTAEQYLREDGLERLAETFEVVIVTRKTHHGWQEQKVEVSGADRYVDDVVVVAGEPEEEPKDIDAVALIDDRQEEHEYCETDGVLFDEDTEQLVTVAENIIKDYVEA